MSTVKIGSARIDENGKAHGGLPGDQTGKEISTQSWYASDKGWILLRARSPEAREKIAACMQAACDNKHIGYDQYQRDTLYNAAKEYGFDVSKVTKDVETDCSALIRVCVNYAGIPVGNFTTDNESKILMATGAFDKFTDDAHCKKSAYLLRGDILVTSVRGHTVAILTDGANAEIERTAYGGKGLKLGDRVLFKGSIGSDVTEMQKALASLGYDLGSYGADGDFGAVTEKALKSFQAKAGLDPTGKYDAAVHEALMARLILQAVKDLSNPQFPIKRWKSPVHQ